MLFIPRGGLTEERQFPRRCFCIYLQCRLRERITAGKEKEKERSREREREGREWTVEILEVGESDKSSRLEARKKERERGDPRLRG
jgi:hypothetical protein